MSQRKMIIFLASAALVLAITVSVGIYAATEDKDLTLVSVDYVENALKPWVKEQVSAGNGIYEVVYLTKGQQKSCCARARPFRFLPQPCRGFQTSRRARNYMTVTR